MTKNRSATPDMATASAEALPEEVLVSAARIGCTRSFETLYSRYNRRILRTIVSITFNQEDAEDALQQTFLRAYMAIGRFEGRSSFYSWITRIAINSSLMILRHRRSHPQNACSHSLETEEDIWITNLPDPAPNPEQAYDKAQQCERLLAAVDNLRPNERMVMERYLADDPSIHDLAASLDISRFAAKSRLHRARIHLASRMKGEPQGRSRSSSSQPSRKASTTGS